MIAPKGRDSCAENHKGARSILIAVSRWTGKAFAKGLATPALWPRGGVSRDDVCRGNRNGSFGEQAVSAVAQRSGAQGFETL